MALYQALIYVPQGVMEGYQYKRVLLAEMLDKAPEARLYPNRPQNPFAVVGNVIYTISHPVKHIEAGIVGGKEFFKLLKQYLERRRNK